MVYKNVHFTNIEFGGFLYGKKQLDISTANSNNYTFSGGGYGHGVGMSQNGAKNLANLGYDAKDILEFYYEGCEVRE